MSGKRKEVVTSIDDAASRIRDGMTVAVGGFGADNHPMALVREIIRNGTKNLTVIASATAGLEIDLLIGAGCVKKLIAPYVGQEIRAYLEKEHLLSYVESILRVYNLHGRRDNIHKARIKILVNQLGIDKFREDVEADWEATHKDAIDLSDDERKRIMSYFTPPDLPVRPIGSRAGAAHPARRRVVGTRGSASA